MTSDTHGLAGAYALDALSDSERVRFERHLRSCEVCAAEVAELRGAAARLADQTWSVPPPRLKEQVLTAASHTRQLPPRRLERVIPPATATARWRRWTAVAAAAAVLAAGAGAAGYALQQQRVRDAQVAAEQTRQNAAGIQAVLSAPDAQLRRGEVAGGGQLTLVVSAQRDAAVVVLAGAAPPEPDQTYQLWLIDGTDPTPAGMVAAATGTLLVEPVRGAQLLGLTVEPAGGSQVPTEPILATVPVD